MFKQDPYDLKPCPLMQTLVSAWVDGILSGLTRRYTEWHVAHCPRCTAAVDALRVLRARLRRLSGTPVADGDVLTPERRDAVEAAWRRSDHPLSSGPPSP